MECHAAGGAGRGPGDRANQRVHTPRVRFRPLVRSVVFSALFSVGAGVASGQPGPRTLVLPPRTIGVDAETARVFTSLLAGELESRRVPIVPASTLPQDAPSGEAACDESPCATELARGAGAERVVFGTLTRLGTKIIVRIRSQATEAPEPDYSDQITATRESDLDAVARRIAETLAGGRPDASRASVLSITEQETKSPRRRASNAGIGLRGQVLLPVADSYGGASQLAGFRMTSRYETPTGIFIESTPIVGLMWGSGNVDWTILDVAVGRVLGTGDSAPYFLGGLGLHTVHVERTVPYTYTDPYYGTYPYNRTASENATTLSGEVGLGWMLLRTYDFSLLADIRYHAVFGAFDHVDGKGAHGVIVSFGTTH